MSLKLTEDELAVLDWVFCAGEGVRRHRAHALLLRDRGQPVREISDRTGLSSGQVYYWLRSFRERRLAAFPDSVVEEARAQQTRAAAPGREPVARKTPGVRCTDPMGEAGRKVLRLHFRRMLKHEPGTRDGVDIEELHDMRVATRRMRSAFRVFAPYYDPTTLGRLLMGLRRTGRVLGRVRDLDVFMDKADEYLQELADGDRSQLDPLLGSWREQREAARTKMVKHLDSKRYRRFVAGFEQFLATPESDEALRSGAAWAVRAALPLRDVVPDLISERFVTVSAYDGLIDDAPLETLHALRIECKRLRYTLEFFEDVLGSEARQAIGEIIVIQDHLGDLNDADVAARLLIGFLEQWSMHDSRERIDISGVVRYLLRRLDELRSLHSRFPSAWRRFRRPELQQLLTSIIPKGRVGALQEIAAGSSQKVTASVQVRELQRGFVA